MRGKSPTSRKARPSPWRKRSQASIRRAIGDRAPNACCIWFSKGFQPTGMRSSRRTAVSIWHSAVSIWHSAFSRPRLSRKPDDQMLSAKCQLPNLREERLNDFLLSVVLGIIEGLTEFLPVSSTAHLRISEALFHISLSNGYWKMYTIVIQLGAN